MQRGERLKSIWVPHAVRGGFFGKCKAIDLKHYLHKGVKYAAADSKCM